MRKFPGQESNLHPSSDPNHSSDNAGFPTFWTIRAFLFSNLFDKNCSPFQSLPQVNHLTHYNTGFWVFFFVHIIQKEFEVADYSQCPLPSFFNSCFLGDLYFLFLKKKKKQIKAIQAETSNPTQLLHIKLK